MEKLVVTRHRGGSFELRSLQACPLQPRHGLQGKKGSRCGVGVPLERRSEWTAAPAQGCNRHNQTTPYRSGGQQGSRPVTLPPQRKQTMLEPEGHDVWGTGQPLPQSRTTALVEIGAQSKQVVHQELDRNEVAWLFGLQHEDHANPRMAGWSPTPRWNQAEDQERALCDLLPRSPLGIGGTQSSLRSRRKSRPSRCFNWRSSKQPSLNSTCDSRSKHCSSNSGAAGIARGNDGARRCSYCPSGIRVDRAEVEERRLENRNPSVAIRARRRRVEGNQEQKQSPATCGAGSTGTSPLAGKHGLSLGRGLDFCQSALSRRDSIHLSNSLPTTHSPRNRESSRNQEQQSSTDRMAYATPLAGDIADLERRECEGRAVATSSHNPKDNAGSLRTSGFIRSARSAQKSCADGASSGIPREIEGAGRYRHGVETRVSLALGVWGCPKSTLLKSANCFGILVSAAGFEPATHALKGHCSTN